MSIRLEIEGVRADYGARPVLRDITLEVGAGEVLVVSGPNGSGKSTLLRLLCGLQRPTAGRIIYYRDQQPYDPSAARPLIGWVAPDLALYRELSAIENLRFFARLRHLRLAECQLEQLLALVGLQGRGEDRVATYSSGMLQRLRYAYALLHGPPVLLLDEPTVTLDAAGAAMVEQVVQTQRQQGLVVIATNDPRELRFADLILRLA